MPSFFLAAVFGIISLFITPAAHAELVNDLAACTSVKEAEERLACFDKAVESLPAVDVTLQQKDMLLALNLGRTLGSPLPLAAAANEMMNACRGLGIDGNDFVVAHQVYRVLGGQS